MSLKERIRANGGLSPTPVGFQLEHPTLLHYRESENFVKAIKAQADNLALVDAAPLRRVDIDGRVLGTDWRLSFAAFSDLCHYSRIPVRFIKDLAKHNDALALEVIEAMLRYRFHSGQDKVLVLDTRCERIEGIVGKETYTPISHQDVIEFALTANPALDFTNGWLSGPHMRMTAAAKTKPVEAKKGDVVLIGSSLQNALNGDRAVRVHDYAERLDCTNGMTSCENLGWNRIVYQGDVEFKVQEAVVRSAGRAQQLVPIMQASTQFFLDDKGIRSIRRFIVDTKNGGNPKLDRKATAEAQKQACKEGREPEEITLWNYINGITSTAHDEDSIQRKQEIEALGYRTLVRFGAVLVN